MNDLRIELRFKNAILGRALEDQFSSAASELKYRRPGLIKVAAQSIGITRSALSDLLNLKASPWKRSGERSPLAEKISLTLCIDFAELFPPQLYSGKFASAKSAELNSVQFLPLGAARSLAAPQVTREVECDSRSEVVTEVLDTLSSNEQKVVRMRLGLDSGEGLKQSEVAMELGLSTARIYQIEKKAFRKLRHPARARLLRQLLA